ncbi:hypothetical protein RUND412_010430 [Rhizina undulata]
MSDIANQPEKSVVDEPPKAVEEITSTSEAAIPTEAATTTIADEKPAEQKPAEEEAPKEEAPKEPELKEITHGLLSKTHGGLLAFFKTKRFFYFQDEPFSEDKLKTYLAKENAKDNVHRAIAAYASQTCKGLLIYSKTEGQKETPHGIIKLADVTEVIPAGGTKFVLKLASGDLHFEAPVAERDSWVHTIKTKIAEAKVINTEITESEDYKAALEKFASKPSPVVAAKEPETTDKDVDAEESKPVAADKADASEINGPSDNDVPEAGPSKEELKRSASKKGKRQSVFSSFLKRDKQPEDKQPEDKKEGATDAPEETTDTAEAVPAAAPTVATEDEEPKSEDVEKPVEPAASPKAPAASKRQSFLGKFFKSDAADEKKPADEKKEEPVKEATVEEVAEEGDAKPEEPSEAAAESSANSPKEKRKTSFFPFGKKGDVKSDTEDDAKSPSSTAGPKNLLTGLLRKASNATKGKEPEAKDVVVPPATVEESEEPTPAAATTEEATAAASEPATTIGDVPDAVTVGSTPPVQAAA